MTPSRRLPIQWIRCAAAVFAAAALAGCAMPPAEPAQPTPALAELRREAAALRPQASSEPARNFLDAVARLAPRAERTIYEEPTTKAVLSHEAHARLAAAEQARYRPKVHDEAFYWRTFYGSPLAYARALDVATVHGFAALPRSRVLDIGYGAIGAPALMAAAGAQVTAVDVDPLLPALYAQPVDQGAVAAGGSLRLLHGMLAADATLTRKIGGGYTLVLSKNTFKRGFMKPAEGRAPLVSFGVADAALLATLRDALAPGGLLVIYNLGGAFDPQRPATDTRSPFDRGTWLAAGFDVLALDRDDDLAARELGRALGWAAQMGDLERNLFARFSVLRRPVP
jgi:SAM-dependent methyltransferase